MLTITIPAGENFDDSTQSFSEYEEVVLELEHSLVSLQKWESKWEKPFLGEDKKSDEEILDYVYMMVLTPHISLEDLAGLSAENSHDISNYIDAKMTATTFSDPPGRPNREIITAEIIYHWMVALTIPFETQHWHLNQLLTLVKVCSKKNEPEKKMGRNDVAARNRALNEERKAKYGTSG